MYRQYENPHALERAIREQERACANCPNEPEEWNYLQELKDRLAQAWQDEEYDTQESY